MPGKTFTEKNDESRLMIEGLKANKEAVAKLGIDEAFITKFEKENNDVLAADAAQEKAKSDLDSATKLLAAGEKIRDDSYAFARKIVKLALPKDRWKEFGIDSTQ